MVKWQIPEPSIKHLSIGWFCVDGGPGLCPLFKILAYDAKILFPQYLADAFRLCVPGINCFFRTEHNAWIYLYHLVVKKSNRD
ncbi:MAG: hypothetical protein JWM28_1135, partial [Chitinophagaceae bacterium]|nr:hypothetical protein [Chitinophagaceae bacterium]